MNRRFANLLIWLALTAEIDGATFSGKWSPPLMYLDTPLFKAVFSIVPWDVLVLITTIVALSKAKPRVPAVLASMKLAVGTLAGIWLWGVLRGGSAYQTYFQLHTFVMGLLSALMVGATCRNLSDVKKLGKVVVSACLYRSFMCILFWWLVASNLPEKLATLTDHFDSVLFVVGWFILLINALETRKWSSFFWWIFGTVPIFTAIVLNNRRLAWAAVAAGLLVTYALLEKTKLKRRITRTLLYLSPLIAAYIAAGWGHPTGIFAPVGSISTMAGEHQDESSKMRDIENYNLLVTMRQNPVLGYGWGREYIEEAVAINIADIFPQYRYMPHNSLLGLVAFTGMVGLWGVWQLIAVSAFLLAKAYAVSRSAVAKAAALSSLVAIIVVQLQMWGDLGLQSQMVNVILAITIGLAQRLPILTSAWAAPQS